MGLFDDEEEGNGNWSPSDYPGKPDEYPPYSSGAAWRSINRDFTISFDNAEVASVYQTVIDKDKANSTTWTPSNTLTLSQVQLF